MLLRLCIVLALCRLWGRSWRRQPLHLLEALFDLCHDRPLGVQVPLCSNEMAMDLIHVLLLALRRLAAQILQGCAEGHAEATFCRGAGIDPTPRSVLIHFRLVCEPRQSPRGETPWALAKAAWSIGRFPAGLPG